MTSLTCQQIDRLEHYAQQHHMLTRRAPNGLYVLVHWLNVHTGERGSNWEHVSTLDDLRRILGY